MSVWYESGKDDLEVDGDEINVFVHADDFGGVYTTIKLADIFSTIVSHIENREAEIVNLHESIAKQTTKQGEYIQETNKRINELESAQTEKAPTGEG